MDDVSFTAHDGQITGLLGPNGAGKTTTMRMLYTLMQPEAGRVLVDGIDVGRDAEAVRRSLGVLPDARGVYKRLTARENIAYFGELHGMGAAQVAERTRRLAEALQMEDVLDRECEGFSQGQRTKTAIARALLWDKADKMSRSLSGGMKRRLMIARAMMTRPRLLILDEPTAGVDIEIRRGMWKTLKEINAAGTTIILTTHYLEEAENLCRNLAIIDHGRIVEEGPMRALLAKLDVEGFLFDIDGTLPAQLPRIEGTTLVASDDHTLDMDMPRAMDLNRVFAAFEAAGIRVRSMRTKSNRLEELFVRLTGKQEGAQA